ncbi:MAG: anti-sigma factor antagonist [Pseudonocardiales bacterium]|nr:anti-sigma factor antagonist [Pseudonocardiales bacterium]
MNSPFADEPRIWTGHGLTVAVIGRHALQTAVRVGGELDLVSAPILGACLQNELAAGRRYGRLNLSDVTFIDSIGLSAVLDAHEAFLAQHGMLVLTGLSARVTRIVQVLNLEGELMISQFPEPAPSADSEQCILQSTG